MRTPLHGMWRNARGRGGMLAAVLLATVVIGAGSAIGQAPVPAAPYPAALAHSPSPLPDRIALTWTGDPAHTQAVTWRTDSTVAAPQAQIAPSGVGPQFTANAVTVPATRSTPVQADLGFPGLFHTVEFTGLTSEAQVTVLSQGFQKVRGDGCRSTW